MEKITIEDSGLKIRKPETLTIKNESGYELDIRVLETESGVKEIVILRKT